MRWITRDDLTDVYLKVVQRGFSFLLSKLNPSGLSRTKSAFDDSSVHNANWWIVPAVRARWNEKITGSKEVEYEEYTVKNILRKQQNLRMLSIGSGVCSHELKFAQYDNFSEIICIDIADNLLRKAEETAKRQGLDNIQFLVKDIYKSDFEPAEFDIIMFHSSLHHFSNIQDLVTNKIKHWLKPKGLLLINEYVGVDRLQFSKEQILHINKALQIIPKRLRQRFKTSMTKNSYHGSGYLRMVIADPSECIESSQILPTIHQAYEVVEEKPYGGNLLMNVLKDISHNFLDPTDSEAQETLEKLFVMEDRYLQENQSDFLFGIYRRK